MENLQTALGRCPGAARYGVAEREVGRWIDTLTEASAEVKKEIDDLIEEQEFTWEKGWQTGKEDCYGDYDDEIDKFKGQVDEKTEQIKALLRSMKRLRKENEKLKEDPQIIDYYHK